VREGVTLPLRASPRKMRGIPL